MRRLALILALFAALGAQAASAAFDPAGAVNVFNGAAPGAEDFGTGGGAGDTFPGASSRSSRPVWLGFAGQCAGTSPPRSSRSPSA